MRQRFALLALCLSLISTSTLARAETEKEWTFLIYLNGHNSLDSYGAKNIKQMEKVGSTENLNIVVQWASLRFNDTKRLLVQKSSDENNVTSPIVETLPIADMGDSKTLVEFVAWAAKKYPAKHYLLNVWNHGGGWHRRAVMVKNGVLKPSDISWDDRSGNVITTPQLGSAVKEISQILGHKLDIFSSDACLMAMLEVGHEMKDSASILAASQEVEPGEGWPYDTFLADWVKAPKSSAAEVSKMLAKNYVAAYSGGEYGHKDVTFSAFDLGKMDMIASQVKALGEEIKNLDSNKRKEIASVAGDSQSYDSPDYKDVVDFIDRLEKKGSGIRANTLSTLRDAVKQSIVANEVTAQYKDSHGISLWIPDSNYMYEDYAKRYSELAFDHDTNWGAVLNTLY